MFITVAPFSVSELLLEVVSTDLLSEVSDGLNFCSSGPSRPVEWASGNSMSSSQN